MANWKTTEGAFKNRKDAQEWEDKTAKDHKCDSSGGGRDPDDINVKWYGYHFDYK